MKSGNIEWIEDYLEGRLSGEALRAFEERMKADLIFAAEVEEHRKFVKDFQFHGKRKALKAKLNNFHQEMKQEQPAAKVVPMLNGKQEERTLFQTFRKVYIPTITVAASVAIITVFSTLYMVEYMKGVEQAQQSNYQQLKGDIRKLEKKTQEVLAKAQTQPAAVKPAPAPQFGGTGFAISSDGYVVTSYHLVNKADSIVIEFEKDPQMHYRAEMIYGDESSDLAVLRVKDEKFKSFGTLPYTFKTENADLGEDIFTLAYPREDAVYGAGSISSQTGHKGDEQEYQISIPVNPGNSGSPIFDGSGNVIGVVSAKHNDADGVAFAKKSATLVDLLERMHADTLTTPIRFPQSNRLARLKRPAQLKKIQEFVFQVKVYSSK